MEPVTVLGQLWFSPDELSRFNTHTRPLRFLQEITQSSSAYRDPFDNLIIALAPNETNVREWHRDGGRYDGTGSSSVILWSNQQSTEILLPNKEIYQPRDFDVVLLNNRAVGHRMPPDYVYTMQNSPIRSLGRRHFARIISHLEFTNSQIKQMKELVKAQGKVKPPMYNEYGDPC